MATQMLQRAAKHDRHCGKCLQYDGVVTVAVGEEDIGEESPKPGEAIGASDRTYPRSRQT